MRPFRKWQRRRALRYAFRHRLCHWDNLPGDMAADLAAMGWFLLYITRHGIRCWQAPDGDTHYYGADLATPAQIRYAVDLLAGEAPESPDGELPDDALFDLLILDALTIMGGTPDVIR